MIDTCNHDRFFVGEILEVNGDLEYKHRFPFMVKAGDSLNRVTLMIQVEERNGVPQEITDPAAVNAYIADELEWEGEVGHSDLWFDHTVCQPVTVRKELDAVTYKILCDTLED